MKFLVVISCLTSVLLCGCARKSAAGAYETRGEEKAMFVDLRDDGSANLTLDLSREAEKYARGSIQYNLVQQLAATVSIQHGLWDLDGKSLTVRKREAVESSAKSADGQSSGSKPVTYVFTLQENGDLLYAKDGFRLFRISNHK